MLDMFDSVGTLVGVTRRAGLADESDQLPGVGRALTADSLATVSGALLGTSTTTAYVESAAGVAVGGKTGLTALVTGLCFLCALLFTPILLMVPAAATSPALVLVGVLMAQGFRDLNYDDWGEFAPALLTALLIPLTFSVTEGIGLGIVVYVATRALAGRFREIPWLTWGIGVLFVAFYWVR